MANFFQTVRMERNSSYPPFHLGRRDLPLTLSAADFEREFPRESQHIEFKNGIGSDQLQDTIVAFSNAEGGVILIGVADDGAVTGRPLDPGTADSIHRTFRDTKDPGRYTVHEFQVAEKPVVAIAVARREDGFAQTSGGVVRVRKGTRDEPLFGAELQRLINERSATRYELTPTGVPLDQIDSELFAGFAEAFGWDEEHVRERLAESDYLADGDLTLAGALYLLPDPAEILGKAYIELLRYQDDETLDYDLRLEIRGPLSDQLTDAAQRVGEELGTELVVLGVHRYDLPRIPPVVIREAIANALAHRDYQLDRTPVRIEIRPSSVQITSPGGLPEPVTVENIREVSAPRNIAAIKALRALGLAEDAGRGIDVMEDSMSAEMLDRPQFEDRGHEVVVTLPVRSAVAPEERAWVRELERRGTLAGSSDRLVLVHAARGETLTNSRVRGVLQTDDATAREVLQRLRDAGFLEQKGRRGGATYRLKGSLAPPAGLRLDEDELREFIVALATDQSISNADVRRATGLERVEVTSLLRHLVAEGRLVQTGQKRGTRYKVR
jgi:ATP-dependent DNA helicase RecG